MIQLPPQPNNSDPLNSYDLLEPGVLVLVEREEYPLPQKNGVKDYIFYMVPDGDAFGHEARVFHETFYKNHEVFEVNTLEKIIHKLYLEVTNNGVNKIREIVIVSHGDSSDLHFHVTNLSLTDPAEEQKYKRVNAGSITKLQQDIFDRRNNTYDNFASERQTVITKLDRDSRVTIRACNFGFSAEGMFTMYVFFGGKANVYGLKAFQNFSRHPLFERGLKFVSRDDMYEHLLKQRFIKQEKKLGKSKNAVIEQIYDKAKVSNPFTIVTHRQTYLGHPPDTPQDMQPTDIIVDNKHLSGDWYDYQQIVSKLNSKQVHSLLDTRFQANSYPLTNKAKVVKHLRGSKRYVSDKEVGWSIEDEYTDMGEKYKVEYFIEEHMENITNKTVEYTLVAYGKLKFGLTEAEQRRKYKPDHSFPVQSFLSGYDYNEIKGHEFDIFFYDPNNFTTEDIQTYQSKVQALDNSDLVTAFANTDFTIEAGATLTQIVDNNTRIGWLLVNDGINYIIKDEVHRLPNQNLYKHITGYRVLNKHELFEAFGEVGTAADAPGTELMAYLDQKSLVELVQYINYMRGNYKERYAYYIHHALQALERKSATEYSTLLDVNLGNIEFGIVMGESPLSLSIREESDRAEQVYEFEVNQYWVQAREGSLVRVSFEEDLFEEHSLHYPPTLQADDPGPDSPSISPNSTSISDLPPGIQKFFDQDKDIRPIVDVKKVDCAKFKEILTILVNRGQQTIPEAIETNKDLIIFDDVTLGDLLSTASTAMDVISNTLEFIALFEAYEGASGVMGWLARAANSRLHFAGSAVFAIYTPLSMFYNIVSQQAEIREAWERRGIAVGWATAAREVQKLMLEYENDYNYDQLPTNINVVNTAPDYEQAFSDFHFYYPLQTSDRVFGWDRAFSAGYTKGLQQGNSMARSTYRRAEGMMYKMLGNKGLSPCMIKELFNTTLVKKNVLIGWVMIQFGVHLSKEARKQYWATKV